MVVAARAFGIVSWRRARSALRFGLIRKQRTFGRMRRLEQIGARLRVAGSMDQLREIMCELSAALDAAGMRCRFETDHAQQEASRMFEWTWHETDGAGLVEDGGMERVVLSFPLDGRDDRVGLIGTLVFWWRCPSPMLQIPEQPLYEWLALLLRGRLLTLVAGEGAKGPSAASGEDRSEEGARDGGLADHDR
jgi:hypothetical protein